MRRGVLRAAIALFILAVLPISVLADGIGDGINDGAHPLNIQGEWTQGAVMRAQHAQLVSLSLNGAPVPVSAAGAVVFGFAHNATPTGTIAYTLDGLDGEHRHTYRYTLALRTYATQRINNLSANKVTPPASVYARINAEQAAINAARQEIWQSDAFMQAFLVPTYGIVTGVYGSRRILNGQPRQRHYGIDIAADTGTPVRAPTDGIIRLASPDTFYAGGIVILDHGAGLTSSFLHLETIVVAAGDTVRQGDAIATVGATGRATGPHLDWRMNWQHDTTHGGENTRRNIRVDVATLLNDAQYATLMGKPRPAPKR